MSYNYLLGTANIKMDAKNRIILPVFSGINAQEKVILFQEKDYFSIYKEDYFNKQIEKLEKEELIDLKHFLILKKRYDELTSNIFSKVEVDNQRRIVIPKIIKECYDLKNQVCIRGAIDHLNVYNNIENSKRLIKK